MPQITPNYRNTNFQNQQKQYQRQEAQRRLKQRKAEDEARFRKGIANQQNQFKGYGQSPNVPAGQYGQMAEWHRKLTDRTTGGSSVEPTANIPFKGYEQSQSTAPQSAGPVESGYGYSVGGYGPVRGGVSPQQQEQINRYRIPLPTTPRPQTSQDLQEQAARGDRVRQRTEDARRQAQEYMPPPPSLAELEVADAQRINQQREEDARRQRQEYMPPPPSLAELEVGDQANQQNQDRRVPLEVMRSRWVPQTGSQNQPVVGDYGGVPREVQLPSPSLVELEVRDQVPDTDNPPWLQELIDRENQELKGELAASSLTPQQNTAAIEEYGAVPRVSGQRERTLAEIELAEKMREDELALRKNLQQRDLDARAAERIRQQRDLDARKEEIYRRQQEEIQRYTRGQPIDSAVGTFGGVPRVSGEAELPLGGVPRVSGGSLGDVPRVSGRTDLPVRPELPYGDVPRGSGAVYERPENVSFEAQGEPDELGRMLEQRLMQDIPGTVEDDPITAALRGRFERDVQSSRDAQIERLNRLGLLRGGGDTADVLADFEGQVELGRMQLAADQQRRQQEALQQGIGFQMGRGGLAEQKFAREQQESQFRRSLEEDIEARKAGFGLEAERGELLKGELLGEIGGEETLKARREQSELSAIDEQRARDRASFRERITPDALLRRQEGLALSELTGQLTPEMARLSGLDPATQTIRGRQVDQDVLSAIADRTFAAQERAEAGQTFRERLTPGQIARQEQEMFAAELTGELPSALAARVGLDPITKSLERQRFDEAQRQFNEALNLDIRNIEMREDITSQQKQTMIADRIAKSQRDVEAGQLFRERIKESERFAEEKRRFDDELALREAGITGTYEGADTLAAQQLAQQESQFGRGLALDEAEVTGAYKGEATQQAEQLERENERARLAALVSAMGMGDQEQTREFTEGVLREMRGTQGVGTFDPLVREMIQKSLYGDVRQDQPDLSKWFPNQGNVDLDEFFARADLGGAAGEGSVDRGGSGVTVTIPRGNPLDPDFDMKQFAKDFPKDRIEKANEYVRSNRMAGPVFLDYDKKGNLVIFTQLGSPVGRWNPQTNRFE